MDAATIISAVITQSGTDASRPTILSVLNERYLEQVAKSQWLIASVELGPTVAGQSTYPLVVASQPPAEIVEILALTVNGFPWNRVGDQDMAYLQAGTAVATVGRGGVFAPEFTATGQAQVELYPTPSASGGSISATAAGLPLPLSDGTGTPNTPITPTDSHGSLIDGATSTVLRRIDERSDLAVPYESIFQAATEDLRKRKNRLVRGSGPIQIQVKGYHF